MISYFSQGKGMTNRIIGVDDGVSEWILRLKKMFGRIGEINIGY